MNQDYSAGQRRDQRPTSVEIDLAAIAHNAGVFKKLLSQKTRLMAVVKADAYGHGAVPVAYAALAGGATWLGVALAQEALELREAGISAPILVLGYCEAADYPALIAEDIRITISTQAQGRQLAQAAAAGAAMGKRAKVHLKIDTGMGRIGFLPTSQSLEEIKGLAGMDTLELEGCFTHFARADEEDFHDREAQQALFASLVDKLKVMGIPVPIAHSANTAAGINFPRAHMDMVRLGIGLYGLSPSKAQCQYLPGLVPALTWKSRLSHTKRLPAGAGVSYGHVWRAAAETPVGTIPAGYSDGLFRRFFEGGQVLVGETLVPVIGRVCMDQCMVDLSAVPHAVEGDEVVLLGKQGEAVITADDIADCMGTVSYEVFCRISNRVPRHYIHKEWAQGYLK